jgi:hypothetical protein
VELVLSATGRRERMPSYFTARDFLEVVYRISILDDVDDDTFNDDHKPLWSVSFSFSVALCLERMLLSCF